MKKRSILLVALTLLLLTCFVLPAAAVRGHVFDEENLLTSSQISELEQLASQVSNRHSFGVYVMTVDSYPGSSLRDFGYDLYRSEGMGVGPDNAGILLIHSASQREYRMFFPTVEHKSIFTEYGLDLLEDGIVGYLRDDDFYGAYSNFISMVDEYLYAYESGEPIDSDDSLPGFLAVIPGAFAALLAGLGLAAPMHSAGVKHDANQYVIPGSLNLRRRSDMFLHRSVVRTPRQTSSSSSHHSTHSSGGMSSRGGKY